jgi:O-antigen ligase
VQAIRQKLSFAKATVGFFALVTLAVAVIPMIGISLEMVAGTSAAEEGSTLARMVMFEQGGSLVFDQPLLGYGPGRAAVTLGFLPGFSVLTIDSYYLTVALESGLPGLLLFITLLGYPIIKGWIGSVRFSGRDRVRIVTITFTLIGFSVIKSVLSLTENFDTAFLLIALLFISLESNKESTLMAQEKTRPNRHADEDMNI